MDVLSGLVSDRDKLYELNNVWWVKKCLLDRDIRVLDERIEVEKRKIGGD